MAGNQESKQLSIASAAVVAAGALAGATRDVPKPSDSFILLEKLISLQEQMTKIYTQLSAWHSQVEHGVHHSGEGEGQILGNPAWVRAELALEEAARHSEAVIEALQRAHTANGVARWYDEIESDAG